MLGACNSSQCRLNRLFQKNGVFQKKCTSVVRSQSHLALRTRVSKQGGLKRRSEQERSSPWRKPELGCLGDQLVGIPRPPPSCRAWSNSSDTRRLAKIQRADFANSAPARGRREGCRGSGVGKKIMHGPWMSWRTSIRADEFRPIFYAPPVRRTIIDEQCSQPSSCLLVAGTVGLGRRKRA